MFIKKQGTRSKYIIQPTPLKGLHLEDREFQQSYITFKIQVHRPYDRGTSNGGSSERRWSTNLHTAPRPFHVTQARGPFRHVFECILPRPAGGALDSIVRIHTLAVKEDVSVVCSLVVDVLLRSGTTPHDDDRVSQCLRGGLSRHLSHVAVRVISGKVDRSGTAGRARPAGLSSPRSIALHCFLVVRIARVSSRPHQMRTSRAARIACMHISEAGDDDRLETGRKPPFHRRHLVSRSHGKTFATLASPAHRTSSQPPAGHLARTHQQAS
jgi:hypothetical protein